ncbi:hypothetical protein D6774_04025 [Candidatus Woesearchaeota archaeon]|nr:MAG: hypothetical protein D6774_04025 [Candidatus Woesearchaeota archaeon]
MKLYLLRHGEADPVTKKLTPKGELQAKETAGFLNTLKIDKIYSSTMERAIQTATFLGKSFEQRSELNEIYRVIVKGPIKEGTPEDREEKDRKRADKFWEEVSKEKKNILLVCHGNIIRYYLNKMGSDIIWENELQPCSLSMIENDNIRVINYVDHLPEHLRSPRAKKLD